MNCRDLVRMVAADDLAEASWVDRLRVRLHLTMCKHCKQYVAQLREIGKAARRPAPTTEPSGDSEAIRRMEQRLIERLPRSDSEAGE